MNVSRVVLVAAALLGPAVALAQQVPFVTTDELKRMVDAKEDFLLADTLSPIEFAEERIAGSVNVPFGALKDGDVKLPPDKTKKLVFYCKGPKCTKSVKTANLAVKMGYTNVLVYNEGLPEWVKRGYAFDRKRIYPDVVIPALSASELKKLLDAKANVLVLDIRDPVDVVAGRIPGALNVDLEDLDRRLGQIPKGRKIVIVDLHGKQTQQAGRFLRWKGYEDVARLDGGFVSGWLRAGLPFEK